MHFKARLSNPKNSKSVMHSSSKHKIWHISCSLMRNWLCSNTRPLASFSLSKHHNTSLQWLKTPTTRCPEVKYNRCTSVFVSQVEVKLDGSSSAASLSSPETPYGGFWLKPSRKTHDCSVWEKAAAGRWFWRQKWRQAVCELRFFLVDSRRAAARRMRRTPRQMTQPRRCADRTARWNAVQYGDVTS